MLRGRRDSTLVIGAWVRVLDWTGGIAKPTSRHELRAGVISATIGDMTRDSYQGASDDSVLGSFHWSEDRLSDGLRGCLCIPVGVAMGIDVCALYSCFDDLNKHRYSSHSNSS
jgi:hypothetical protein